MADPAAARITQLKNIQAKTGKTIAELHAAIAKSGLEKVGERRSMLMEKFKLGYGDANAVALLFGKPVAALEGAPAAAAPAASADPLDDIYVGAKAPLRPLHEKVMKLVRGFGDFEVAPKKGYVSLRRKKQFAMVGPATKDQVEIGLNAKALKGPAQLKEQPAGGMCQYKVRIAAASEIDKELEGWLKAAYDSAG